MRIGNSLHRIARISCSADLCDRVLEPSIADLQHDYAHADRRRARLQALVAGYAAFWRSFGWCLVRDAGAPDSRLHLVRASAVFAIVVAVMGAVEALLLHTQTSLREAVLRALYAVPYGPYVGWSARLDTATLMFGVPLAMFPVLLLMTRDRRVEAAAPLSAIAAGTLLTIVSAGWIAPAVVRWDALRQHDRRIVAGDVSRSSFDLDACPECRSWPGLIAGAFAPLRHRYPGYPNYVAPEDRDLPQWHRLVIRERLLLVLLATFAGLIGWRLGVRSSNAGTGRGGR